MRIDVSGELSDEPQDGAVIEGPFSALCASIRPGEEEREAGDGEVPLLVIVHPCFYNFFEVVTQGLGPNAQPLYTWDEFGFRVEEEDGPEDTSSKLLSIPFTEVFLKHDDDAMMS